MAKRQWWEKPKLRTDEEEERERRVGWLELFYDLVFVVVIAQLSHYLAEHITLQGVITFGLLFIPVWWVWIGNTFYNERFETHDVSNRIFTFLQMVPVAGLAVSVHAALGETSTEFALSYIAVRILLIIMWLRGGWHEKIFWPVARRYATGFSLSVLLFIISLFTPPPWRFMLWGLGLLIDLITPITTLKQQIGLPRLSTSRLPERFGLFVIIVLGETVVGVVNGVAEKPLISPEVILTGILGMALGFGLWWVYFDFVARRQFRPGVWWSLTWSYLHLPLVMSITATGAGIANVIASQEAFLPDTVRLLISGAVSAALIIISLIELSLRRATHEPTDYRVSVSLKIGGGLIALGLGVWGSGLGYLGLLFFLFLCILAQMVYGAYVWFRQPLAEPIQTS
jgi:low temperature requirement protein LtrA